MGTKAEYAISLHDKGYNCAQAVFLAYADRMDMDEKTAAKLASSFGGGMGCLREVCGAVSGMFMVTGMLYGYDDPKAPEEKKEHYGKIQELAAKFKEQNGSIVCRELLGLDGGANRQTPELRTAEYYKKRPCKELVGMAAEILEAEMLEWDKTNEGK